MSYKKTLHTNLIKFSPYLLKKKIIYIKKLLHTCTYRKIEINKNKTHSFTSTFRLPVVPYSSSN